MGGDWDNGEGRVDQAQRLLGPELFEIYKTRYPDKYQRLIEIDAENAPPAYF
jgi:hypothetical protein